MSVFPNLADQFEVLEIALTTAEQRLVNPYNSPTGNTAFATPPPHTAAPHGIIAVSGAAEVGGGGVAGGGAPAQGSGSSRPDKALSAPLEAPSHGERINMSPTAPPPSGSQGDASL